MQLRIGSLLSFPDPVNEVAARVVAGGVVTLCGAAAGWREPWLLVPLAYGFWARVLTGPSLSPLGQVATRIVAPRLPIAPRPVPGPPKRFAQGIGAAFSSAAVVLWFGFGQGAATWAVVGVLGGCALLESALGLCLGCRVFALLMRAGVVPPEVCEACADVRLRDPRLLAARRNGPAAGATPAGEHAAPGTPGAGAASPLAQGVGA